MPIRMLSELSFRLRYSPDQSGQVLVKGQKDKAV